MGWDTTISLNRRLDVVDLKPITLKLLASSMRAIVFIDKYQIQLPERTTSKGGSRVGQKASINGGTRRTNRRTALC